MNVTTLTVNNTIVNPIDYGTHSVFWTHDGFFAPAANQTDLQYTNVASISYGSTIQSGVSIALFPATNTATLADPVFDFTCNYTGTNLMCASGANSSANWYFYEIDGDSNYPYTAETNTGTGWIHFTFSKSVQHAIRFRINGKQFHAGVFRIMTGDTISATVESAHRVSILMFGDSHIDGNTSAGEMDTLVNRSHRYLATACNVFGSALGGSGVLALGGSGFPYTNRFWNDVFVQQAKPDILIWEGSNDHALIVNSATSNAFIAGVSNMSFTISTNIPGTNVWVVYGPQPAGTGQIDNGSIFCRNVLKTNCLLYGFNFIDFLGGATNTSDVNRGYINDSNFSTMWNSGHLTEIGKEWFAELMATNMNPTVLAIDATK